MIAWVTGGGTGIGRALAECLYSEGACVMITGRRKEVLEKTAAEISARHGLGQILSMAGDASDPAHVKDVIAETTKRWGPIQLLINNAGVNRNHDVSLTPIDEYLDSFSINCLAAIRTTQAVLPEMLRVNRGTIVNVSSVYGKWSSARSASYSVGKYALSGYTDSLRQWLVGTRVHVLGVYPGFIKTAMTAPFVEPGSLKSYIGKSPHSIAKAILKAVRRRKAELYYPWYVSWLLRFHRWFPALSDAVAQRVKR